MSYDERDKVEIPTIAAVIVVLSKTGSHRADCVARAAASIVNSLRTEPDNYGAHVSFTRCCRISRCPHVSLSSCLSVLLSLACDRMSESLPISVSCSRIYLIPIFSLSVSSYVAAVVLCACLLSLHVSLDVCFSARLKIVSRIISRSSASCILPSLGSCIYPSSARQKPQTLQRHQIVYCTSERSWHDSRSSRHQLA